MRGMIVAVLGLLGVGCASPPSSRYVTQDQLHELLALPDVAEPPAVSEHQRAQVDALVLASFTAPETPAEVSKGAAALAVADRRLAPLAKALGQIDAAVQVCALNLANAETTAYKSSYAVSNPDGTVVYRNNTEQGSLQNTGRQLDVGISGQGFFKVKLIDSIGGGFAYTRNGNFFVNRDGTLVLGMGDGYALEPKMVIPKGATDVAISQDGGVEITIPGSNRKARVGQFQVIQFVNAEALNPLGGSLFTQTETSGAPVEYRPGDGAAGTVLQGFLECSNVDTTRERLRIRFLQNWRQAILKAIEDAK